MSASPESTPVLQLLKAVAPTLFTLDPESVQCATDLAKFLVSIEQRYAQDPARLLPATHRVRALLPSTPGAPPPPTYSALQHWCDVFNVLDAEQTAANRRHIQQLVQQENQPLHHNVSYAHRLRACLATVQQYARAIDDWFQPGTPSQPQPLTAAQCACIKRTVARICDMANPPPPRCFSALDRLQMPALASPWNSMLW